MRKRTLPGNIKEKFSLTFTPVVLRQLDEFCGEYSRSAIVEIIVGSYLEMAAEEGIKNYDMLLQIDPSKD